MSNIQKKPDSALKEIIAYTLPELYTGKEWYVGFYAFDPLQGKMRRKKIKINFIKGTTKRRKYGEGLKQRLIEKLSKGWNPWIEQENSNAYHTFTEVLELYRKYADKMFADELWRPDTHKTYISYCRNLENWNNEENKVPITYIYQFNQDFCAKFLESIYIDRDNSATTRDNYRSFLNNFSEYCLQHSFISANPIAGIGLLSRRNKKKKRTTLPDAELIRLQEYLIQKNKHYLLACYILNYCFIRPKEMSMLRIHNFSLKYQTVFVADTVSKNRSDGTITLPAKVIRLMLDLDIFNYPGDFYLFSDKFLPGEKFREPKQFRDYWTHYVRKDLKFPEKYKFYSLKDTGITNMLRNYDTLSVRDQARHSSIATTDLYTPHDIEMANELIKNYEGVF
ncbi:site-specific integrase [Parabacteroides goldsteinii]|uniref:tyrosine-type recombinase/integrase n=1 Tax=Parabacteroides goldsteinii TaxID=328812 RepID=UPI00256FC0CA|nr:site-specific integrase [Parabacteroides goldsteinii]